MTQGIETLGMEVPQCEVPECDVSRDRVTRGARDLKQNAYDSLVNPDGENMIVGVI